MDVLYIKKITNKQNICIEVIESGIGMVKCSVGTKQKRQWA
jgi:hypothetical protein